MVILVFDISPRLLKSKEPHVLAQNLRRHRQLQWSCPSAANVTWASRGLRGVILGETCSFMIYPLEKVYITMENHLF